MKTTNIRFDDDAVTVVESFRKAQDEIPSFNKAVNEMLKRYGAILALENLKGAISSSPVFSAEQNKVSKEVEKNETSINR